MNRVRAAAVVLVLAAAGGGAGVFLAGGGPGASLDTPSASTQNEATQQILPWVDTGTRGDPYAVATTEGAKNVYLTLRTCYPNDKATNEDIYEQTPCFKELVEELATTADPADFFSGIKAVVVERPDVFAVCHDAGHKGSDILLRRFWNPGDPLNIQAEQLDGVFSVVNDTCMSGFIHGLFDTLGYLKAAPESFDAAMRSCTAASNRDPSGFDCADGMGHAAWEATLDLEQATILCTKFQTNEKRVICDGGVIMRMYQHLESKDPWYLGSVSVPGFDVARWMEIVSAICQEWPEDVQRELGSAEGCWAGTPYLFFKPLYSQIAENGNDFEANKVIIAGWLALMGEACDSYGDVGADVCYKNWTQYLGMTAMYDEKNMPELCSRLPARRKEVCVQAGVGHIAQERERNQAVR